MSAPISVKPSYQMNVYQAQPIQKTKRKGKKLGRPLLIHFCCKKCIEKFSQEYMLVSHILKNHPENGMIAKIYSCGYNHSGPARQFYSQKHWQSHKYKHSECYKLENSKKVKIAIKKYVNGKWISANSYETTHDYKTIIDW